MVVLRLYIFAVFMSYYRSSFILFIFIAVLLHLDAHAQKNVNKNFPVYYQFVDKDNPFTPQSLGLQTAFESSSQAFLYINKLPATLIAQGFPAVSIDSVRFSDSVMNVLLYLGQRYENFSLNTDSVDKRALEAAAYNPKDYNGKPLNMERLNLLKNRIIDYYEANGYPFATVSLDSVRLSDGSMKGNLRVDKGPDYVIDSIRVIGKAKLNAVFLQQYLNIKNGSVYNKKKLQQVDQKILELPYITTAQSSDVTMLGTGSVLNLYLEDKKSSQVNFIVGFLPAATPDGNLQITGDVNLDLKNLLGSGENFLLRWQSLQPKSPRLNIGFDQPFIFKSRYTFSGLFDLFKKDSNFIQVNAQAGLQFALSQYQFGKIFVQIQNNSLLEGAIDTNVIKQNRQLPLNIDVSSVNTGLSYSLQNTNYLFNPRRGNEAIITGAVGIKKIKKNNQISQIKDPNFNFESLYDSLGARNYQLRIKLGAAHYFPVGKRATVKTAINGGWYSSPNVFRNELFQIGGNRLLRGFNEESIYAKQYAVTTAEYRYLTGLNSYLFSFLDLGFAQNKFQDVDQKNIFTGFGLGIVNETKIGLLNLSVAVGKRDDISFNLRESVKIHFGYVSYF